MSDVASLDDRRRAHWAKQVAELELDIALWSATVRLIHEGWKDPAVHAGWERLTYSQIHADVASKLRAAKFTAEDGTPIPITRALEAIGNIPYVLQLEDCP